MKRRLGYAIRRRIAALDPVEDNEEAARLTFEVLYGDPITVHAAYLVGFSRQVAVPSIARVIYQGGSGDNLRDVARRTDDTLALFGAFFRWGHSSPRGRAAIARMEQIHARFPITDEQKRYTLATLIFEGDRIGRHLGFDPFTADQREASWRFWHGVAGQMPLGELPETADELWRWMLDYEREHWRYTEDGRRVVDRFFEDWTTRWFPRPARGLGRLIGCGAAEDVRAFCPNRSGCNWPEKAMSPQLHTASSAYSGHGLTLVNPPLEEHAQRRSSQEFVVASIARWLGECTDEEASKLIDQAGEAPDPEIIGAIDALEAAGLSEKADALRARFVPVGLEELRTRVTYSLGFDPLSDPVRGPQLAANLDDFERVLALPQLGLEQLEATDSHARHALYEEYRPALSRAGFDPDGLFLVKEFPITYLAVGHSRGGFGPHESDLVAYKGRAAKGQALRTLIYAHPTETEALVFRLDSDRVARWLIQNGAATAVELDRHGGVSRWLAAHMDEYDGHLPPPWDPEREPDPSDPEYGPRLLLTLLHSVSHQMLRALAVDSGFSETALSEYLFPFSLAFAIHPNGGSEFTIGGLRTVLEQNLAEILIRAVDNDTCIYDPNCMIAERGADHGCLQLPETACQAWNWFISRWELFGSPDGEVTGYWSPEFDSASV